jgi:hypothetical protein
MNPSPVEEEGWRHIAFIIINDQKVVVPINAWTYVLIQEALRVP